MAAQPIRQLRESSRLLGLVLYGVSSVLLVRGTLGVMPWDVLPQGVTRNVPPTLAQVIIVVSRDGLMTRLARRTGWSLRLVRTAIEVAVVLVGVTLGGVLGVATIAYALFIGPLTQTFLPWFVVPLGEQRTRELSATEGRGPLGPRPSKCC